jgi:hypothetical protein
VSTPPENPPELSEEELRAAWEEQLSQVTTTDLIIQTAVSLVNLAGRRLGTAPGTENDRDLAQVRDAIDGVRALVPILERGAAAETLGPLRDAISALQIEYAKLASAPASRSRPAAASRRRRAGTGRRRRAGAAGRRSRSGAGQRAALGSGVLRASREPTPRLPLPIDWRPLMLPGGLEGCPVCRCVVWALRTRKPS